MGVVCLGKEARLQKPHKLFPGTTFELRRPGDAGRGAVLSSPRDHPILKVSTQPRGGFAFSLLTWQQKGKKTFLVFKPKVALVFLKISNILESKRFRFRSEFSDSKTVKGSQVKRHLETAG